jgi:DNA-binding MarR family transcriptional regulator
MPPRPAETGRLRSVDAVRALARASRMLERSSGELSLAQYRVLSAVATGDERASRIAVRLALGKPTISATVDGLCQRGWLTRAGVDGDQRAAALHLTPAGRDLLTEVETEMIARIDALAARTVDPDALLDALAALGDAIDQLLAERSAQRSADRVAR